MRIANLYAGIGGNRKLWGDEHDVTAIEFNEEIAYIYQDLYKKDTVIVTDAHEWLLNNFQNYDFIWASPPCPTHSRTNYFLKSMGVLRYPDMKLYQEIIFLDNFFKGKYVVENVISYYDPLIKPQQSGRHYFWSNFKIPPLKNEKTVGRMCGKKEDLNGMTQADLRKQHNQRLGFDLEKYSYKEKQKLLNNCVEPEIGLTILESAIGIFNANKNLQTGLFSI